MKSRINDFLVTAGILVVSFLFGIVTNSMFQTDALVPMVFVLAVFLTSVITKGYLCGIIASMVSTLAVNFAFTFPYFEFNFTIPENLFSAVVMLVVAIVTGALTTKIKQTEKIKADSEREKMRANLLRQSDTHTLVMIESALDSNYKNIINEICPEIEKTKAGQPLHCKRLPFLRTMLEAEDYQVLCAADCAAGLSMFSSHCPDLVVLDLGLPDQDGVNFITFARQFSQAPILVLSARTTDHDKVAALDLGANDYVTKPFSTAELLARVRSALRNRRYDDQDGILGDTFDVSDLHIDFSRRTVTLSGREIRLTQTEYNIVTVLAHHAGRVMTYASIIRAVWGSTDEGSVKKLQVNLANIRKKLGERPGERRYISNELGVGYRMISDDE